MQLDSYLSEKHRKRRKRERYLYLTIGVVLFYIILVGTTWVFLRSPLFRVSHIQIQGNSTVSSDDVTALVQSAALRDHNFWKAILGFHSMLIWPDSLSPADLAFNPRLASVTLARDYFSQTLTVTVVERQPFAIWCFVGGATGETMPTIVQPAVTTGSGASGNANESCYWMDRNGILFGRTFDTQGSLVFAVHDLSQKSQGLGQTALAPSLIPNAVSVLSVLAASGIKVEDITLKDISLQELAVATYEGPSLYFSLRFPAEEDLQVLQNLMAKANFNKLAYVDFRVEHRAYYK